jgi:hypothetical protein
MRAKGFKESTKRRPPGLSDAEFVLAIWRAQYRHLIQTPLVERRRRRCNGST